LNLAEPRRWGVQRLRDVAELRVSNVDKHEKEGEIPVRLCNYVDVYKNDRITEGIPFMRATATPVEIERFRIRRGDVLMTKDSETWTDIGVPALVEYEADDLVSGYHLALLRPRYGHLVGGFLLRALQSPDVAHQLHVAATGVTRYGLSHAAIKSVVLPVPPLADQADITRFLDHADRRIRRSIRAKQKLIVLMNEQKQAVIHRVVTRGLDPNVRLKSSGVEWLGDVPEHWDVLRVKNVLRVVDERSVTGAETLLSLRRDHGVVVFADHFSRPPQGATAVGYKLVAPSQIVVNRLQANNGLIFTSTVPGVISPDYSVFSVVRTASPEYVSALLRMPHYRAQFRRSARGLGTGTAGFLRLYDDELLATPIALPPLEEQQRIMSSLEAATAKGTDSISAAERAVNLLREFRTRLIADVVTGKLEVSEAAARLPDEVEPEPLDDAEVEAIAEEDIEDLEPIEA
jgi:type I restriction enzyme S subunit